MYGVDTQPTHGMLVLSATGMISYTPDQNFFGTDIFTYHVNDGVYSSSIATVQIVVNAVNDSPIALSGSYSILGNISNQNGNILYTSLSGSDIDGDILNYILKTNPVHGSLTLSSTGMLSYTPAI